MEYNFEDVNVMSFNEMRKAEKLEFLKDYIIGSMQDADLMDAVCDFIDKMKEQVDKKNAYNKSKRQEKAQATNSEREVILNYLSSTPSVAYNIPQLAEGLGWTAKNTSWFSSRLTALVKNGLVEKVKSEVKKDRKGKYRITQDGLDYLTSTSIVERELD